MENLFVKLDINSVRNGVVATVGARNFAILAVISTFSDDKGYAYPSQETIAELSGFSRQTIIKAINDIKKIDIDGEPAIKVSQKRCASGVKNGYHLSPKLGLRFGNDVKKTKDQRKENEKPMSKTDGDQRKDSLHEEEPINNIHNKQEPLKQEPLKEKEVVFDNPKAVLEYYQQKFFDTYNDVYSPNYPRDYALIKRKITSMYASEDIKVIIDVAFREYGTRWANPKYPRLSLGQIGSWIANEALAIASKEKYAKAENKTNAEKYDMTENDWESLLDKI